MTQFPDSVPPPYGSSPAQRPRSVLRKLVRSRATQLFLTQQGNWTPNIWEADCFPDPVEAYAFVRKRKIECAEYYYSFEERRVSQFDFGFLLQLDFGTSHPEPAVA